MKVFLHAEHELGVGTAAMWLVPGTGELHHFTHERRSAALAGADNTLEPHNRASSPGDPFPVPTSYVKLKRYCFGTSALVCLLHRLPIGEVCTPTQRKLSDAWRKLLAGCADSPTEI